MKRLPNVMAVVETVKTRAEACKAQTLQKLAEEVAPSFSTSLAVQMHKLAQQLRTVDVNEVGMAEVEDFARQLMRRT